MPAEVPWKPVSLSKGGTKFPTLRSMKRSPGKEEVMRSGATRESAQAMKRVRGLCPSATRLR